jgi:LAGLIDADG endonuclease
MGAGNQQGRSDDSGLAYYVAGFVDGEGSFHVAVQRNPTVRTLWQIVPEFQVSQHEASKEVLDLLQSVLGCGYIKPNHKGNSRDVTWVFVVRSRHDLATKVIPFFRKYGLRTQKRQDFETFSEIVTAMCEGRHKTTDGLSELLKLAFSMNKSGKYRRVSLEKILNDLEPSETVRQTSPDAGDEDTVRSVRRRAEAGRKTCPPCEVQGL